MDYHFWKKTLLVSGTALVLVSSISLVFGNFVVLGEDVEVGFIESKNIYLSSDVLNKTLIGYKTQSYLGDLTVHSSCPIVSHFVGDKNFLSYFEVTFTDKNCKNPSIYLKNGGKIILNSEVKLNIVPAYDLYNILLDLSSEKLQKMKGVYKTSADKLSLFKDYEYEQIPESVNFAMKKRQYKENQYKANFIDSILLKREQKYSIPVVGYKLPTRKDKVPEARRPFRTGITDGVHHSWDIDTPLGEQIVSLDDALVVRVVDSWNEDSFSNIRNENLSEEDKIRNLDILRGNQVWLKTMKGEVVMYNHIDKIFPNIQEGVLLERGALVGTIGNSGVGEGYTDYHLDFSIHDNPYNEDTAGTYDWGEYMSWPRKMKGKTYDYIIEHQGDYFEQE